MSDEITITLPVSGKEVVIRNYTNRGDDEASEAILYKGVATNHGSEGDSVNFPIANVMAADDVYVKRLVKSVGGGANVQDALRELRTADYAAVQEAVDKVREDNSPKAKKVEENSPAETVET